MLLSVTVGVSLVTWKWQEAVAARKDADAAAERRARDEYVQKAADERQARLAERHQARLALSQGLLLCEQGDPAQGLLWLTRAGPR